MQRCDDCGDYTSYWCFMCSVKTCHWCFEYPLIGICSMYCMCEYVYSVHYPVMIKDQQEKLAIIDSNNKKTNVWTNVLLKKYLIKDVVGVILDYFQ